MERTFHAARFLVYNLTCHLVCQASGGTTPADPVLILNSRIWTIVVLGLPRISIASLQFYKDSAGAKESFSTWSTASRRPTTVLPHQDHIRGRFSSCWVGHIVIIGLFRS